MDVVVWTLRAALVALAFYSLAVTPRFTTRPLLVASALAGLAGSALFQLVPSREPRVLRASEAASLAGFVMHVSGHAFGLYAAFAWYDKTLHVLIPFAVVLVLHGLSRATPWIWDWSRVTALQAGVFLFSMTLTVATLWEIFEFGMDSVFGTEEQNGLADTMWDLVMGAVGALAGVVLAGRFLNEAHEEARKNGYSGLVAASSAAPRGAR